MGRNGQPISLVVKNGKKHLTKAEIEFRRSAELKIGGSVIICPESVKRDVIALQKWDEIITEYEDAAKNGIDIIKSTDVGILERYCKTYSRIQKYLAMLDKAKRIDKILHYEKLLKQLNDDNRKDEDRLFLNPLAKVKNVPKKERKKDDPLADKGFGNV